MSLKQDEIERIVARDHPRPTRCARGAPGAHRRANSPPTAPTPTPSSCMLMPGTGFKLRPISMRTGPMRSIAQSETDGVGVIADKILQINGAVNVAAVIKKPPHPAAL